jgi:hypothetical protein
MHSLDNILDAAVAIFERGGSAASAAATPHFLHEKFELLRGHNYYIFTKHIYGSILIQMVNKLNFFCPALFFLVHSSLLHGQGARAAAAVDCMWLCPRMSGALTEA